MQNCRTKLRYSDYLYFTDLQQATIMTMIKYDDRVLG